MAMNEITLRVNATWHLTVAVGDAVRRGQKMNEGPDTDESSRAPVSGTVKSIQFDPGPHEFVIVIAPAA
jgi:Na+-translocating ferredoxin:NAD+ oxidoreductase RnfC subunit